MLMFDYFSFKAEFFKFELFLVSFTYLISSSQNFVIFSSKTNKVIKKSYFLQVLKYLQLCLILLNMSCINFQEIWKLYRCINTRLLTKGKGIISSLMQKRYSQKFMINIRKYQVYIITQKGTFQQIRQKATNQTLNINCQNTLAEISFLN